MDINENSRFDAVIIGAGFSGMYMLHKLRKAGFSARVYEAGTGVGGTWYWNRYPGAQSDSDSIEYNFTFSEEIYEEWTWSSRFPAQEEILTYLNFVADKLDLRRDIQLKTSVLSANFNEQTNLWDIQLENGTNVSAKYFITGVGCLSAANIPDFKGLNSFEGAYYHTGRWPHEGVDFKGKRVGIIGTGSTAIQSIPIIAKEADHLTVFQRTPQFSIPANNHPLDPEFVRQSKKNHKEMQRLGRESIFGFVLNPPENSALDDTPEERKRVFEEAWQKGGWHLSFSYGDLLFNEKANELVGEFVKNKIREKVKDPKTAEMLTPKYFYGTKRIIMDTNYFEVYNRDNVSLVDVKQAPIQEITPKGIRTADAEYELDIIVFATGYDAMTGPLFKIDIRGRDGVSLKEKWADGAETRSYLGVATNGFPNFFTITGPQSPSVLSNMPVSIEQHVEWISDCITYLRYRGVNIIEAQADAEIEWAKHCQEVAETTLFTKTDSWYTGANIEGKPRGFLIYLGGVGAYRQLCSDIAAKGYEGFDLVSTGEVVS